MRQCCAGSVGGARNIVAATEACGFVATTGGASAGAGAHAAVSASVGATRVSQESALFQFQHAIVRDVSSQFAAEVGLFVWGKGGMDRLVSAQACVLMIMYMWQAVRMEGSSIDQARTVAEHAEVVRALKEIVPNVIELPADEKHPDCMFVEDTAVVLVSMHTTLSHSIACLLSQPKSSPTPYLSVIHLQPNCCPLPPLCGTHRAQQDGLALLCSIGHTSRQGEEVVVGQALTEAGVAVVRPPLCQRNQLAHAEHTV